MVNCNPETVSTDYDTSDRLYFEPLDVESVLAVCEREQPAGVVIQFGGQTPLKLARAIEAAGFKVLGTPYEAVDLAEDRERFGLLLDELGVRCPEWGIADTPAGRGRDRRSRRLPRPRPPLVRPRRPSDAGLLRRGAGTGRDGRCNGVRHLSIASSKVRSRSTSTRSATASPCTSARDGARRGGGDPLRRLVVRPAGPLARRGRVRGGLPGRAPARSRRSVSSGC
jgi:carbamoylphosphate synthase large subunit